MVQDRPYRMEVDGRSPFGPGRIPGPPLAWHAEASRWLARLADHDPASALHSLRVERYAGWIAAALGLDEPTRTAIALAARLHDVGKMAVPRAVLQYPGGLSAEEHRLVRTHPVVSERIVRAVVPCPLIGSAVRSHHERMDGTGYPDRLTGRCIPVAARVLAVADAFDAMTSARPYRRPVTIPRALELLQQAVGTQVDGEMVAALARALRRHRPGATAEALLSAWSVRPA